MKVIFIVPYPKDEAPSQRFRFELFYTDLQSAGINYEIQSFIDIETWRILYKPGNHLKKLLGILKGFLRRALLLFRLHHFDWVLIHREATPIGPPLFEWLIAKVFRKKIIYDFDDAIWLPNVSESNRFISKLKWYAKVASICKWSYKISCGNAYLAQFARKYNNQVFVIPTVVDTEIFKPAKSTNRIVTLGWTGSVSTNRYLEQIEDILFQVQENTGCNILCISNRPPRLQRVRFEFIQWQKEKEVNDLQRIDIGIMPLPDDEWSKGKCGFKLIQYLSVEKPAVASPVGVNTDIIKQGENGYLCISKEEWIDRLTQLCHNEQLRKAMGVHGRKHIVANYSRASQVNKFISLFY